MASYGALKMAASRQGKKQLLAYIPPEQNAALEMKLLGEGKTKQQAMAEVVNAVFAFHGRMPPIIANQQRLMRRVNRRAVMKAEDAPRCRVGRFSFGGWFEAHEVDSVLSFLAERNANVEMMAEFGLKMVTDYQPDRLTAWELQQPANSQLAMPGAGRPSITVEDLLRD